jgi:polar amino acid transport system substrate-binding protein
MDRRLVAVGVVVWSLGISPGHGADLEEIRARGTLRVLAADDESPMWFSTVDGPTPGFEREVLEGFARLHQLKFVVVPIVRWEEALPDLLKGKGDLLAGLNQTEARRKVIDFTTELLPARNVVVTLGPRVVRTLDEFRRERVAVVPQTTWWDAAVAAGVPATRLLSVPDVPGAIQALREDQAGAAVIDVVDFFFERRKDPELKLGPTLGAATSSVWGVRKEDPQLRRALDLYLEGLRKSPAWSRLVVKYFGEDALAILGRGGP